MKLEIVLEKAFLVRKDMRNKHYFKAYKFEFDYEFNTYQNVGKDYGNRKTANKGWLINLIRWNRKRKNKNDQKYKTCNTYLEWREYVITKIPLKKKDRKNMYHYLLKNRNEARMNLDIAKSIIVPIELAVVSFYVAFCDQDKVNLDAGFVFIIILVTVLMVKMLSKEIEEVSFYNDYIDIFDENDKAI